MLLKLFFYEMVIKEMNGGFNRTTKEKSSILLNTIIARSNDIVPRNLLIKREIFIKQLSRSFNIITINYYKFVQESRLFFLLLTGL